MSGQITILTCNVARFPARADSSWSSRRWASGSAARCIGRHGSQGPAGAAWRNDIRRFALGSIKQADVVARKAREISHRNSGVLKFGADVEVLAPPDLRSRVADEAARMT